MAARPVVGLSDPTAGRAAADADPTAIGIDPLAAPVPAAGWGSLEQRAPLPPQPAVRDEGEAPVGGTRTVPGTAGLFIGSPTPGPNGGPAGSTNRHCSLACLCAGWEIGGVVGGAVTVSGGSGLPVGDASRCLQSFLGVGEQGFIMGQASRTSPRQVDVSWTTAVWVVNHSSAGPAGRRSSAAQHGLAGSLRWRPSGATRGLRGK